MQRACRGLGYMPMLGYHGLGTQPRPWHAPRGQVAKALACMLPGAKKKKKKI